MEINKVSMKKVVVILLLCIFIFPILIHSIFCQESSSSKQLSQIMYVIAGDGINMREKPSIQSQKIKILPFLTKVNVIEKDENLFTIDGINSQWYKVISNNVTGWVFGGYLSNNIEIQKQNNNNFIAVYRINNIHIGANSFGHENIIKRLKKSYLVIYEANSNKRYIYDDEGLIEKLPRFGDGIRGHDIIVTGIYKYPWTPIEDNLILTDTTQVTFQSRRINESNEIIYNYNIFVTYERILFE